jgi:Tol biopolymer transport system component/DNA-binding winged helix-turn-helix (wHTH) protein
LADGDVFPACRLRADVYTGTVFPEFRVAGALVQPALNRVTVGEDAVRLEPKVMHVLVRLAEQPGEVVTRDALVAAVWPDVFVTDDVLNRAVRELRKVFGDSPDQPRVIETIRKRGYRLIATVERPESANPSTLSRPITSLGVDSEPTLNRFGVDSEPTLNPVGWVAAIAALLMTVGLVVAVATWRSPERATPLLPSRFVAMTTGEGNEVDPALSPDGDRLAYAAAGADGTAALWLESTGRERRRLTGDGTWRERGPAWSPDGLRIAFVRYTTTTSEPSCDVMLLDLDGNTPRRLTSCGNAHEFRMTWSPDGRWLLISHDPGHAAGWQVARVSVATGERQFLTLPPPGIRGDHSPVLSPDGRRLAFVRSISGSVADLYVAGADGRNPLRLTRDGRDIVGVVWARDGRSIVIASDRAGGYALWRVPIDGGGITFVAGGGGEKIKHPTSAARADAVAYEGWDYEINVWEIPVASGENERPLIAAANQWTFQPAISPDNRSIAFTSNRSGAYEIWLAERDGSRPRQLTSFAGSFAGMPRWSPDGLSLLVTARVNDRAEALIVPAAGGEPRRISPAGVEVVAPSWSSDGRSIYYGASPRGEFQVWKTAADGTGTPTQVTTAGGYSAIESHDGAWLYFTRVDRPGLWRVRTAPSGTEELITADLRQEDWASWTPVRAGVYYLRRDPSGTEYVAFKPEDGGAERRVASLPEMASGGFALAPDERTLLYARADRQASNIVKAEFSGGS